MCPFQSSSLLCSLASTKPHTNQSSLCVCFPYSFQNLGHYKYILLLFTCCVQDRGCLGCWPYTSGGKGRELCLFMIHSNSKYAHDLWGNTRGSEESQRGIFIVFVFLCHKLRLVRGIKILSMFYFFVLMLQYFSSSSPSPSLF